MTNVEALKLLFVALGGEAAIIASAETNVDALNAIAGLYEGETTATTIAEAIENIAAVAENIGKVPVLVEKTVTENGTYDPADDEADASHRGRALLALVPARADVEDLLPHLDALEIRYKESQYDRCDDGGDKESDKKYRDVHLSFTVPEYRYRTLETDPAAGLDQNGVAFSYQLFHHHSGFFGVFRRISLFGPAFERGFGERL